MGVHWYDSGAKPVSPDQSRLVRVWAVIVVVALVAGLVVLALTQRHHAYDPDPPCTQQQYSAEQC